MEIVLEQRCEFVLIEGFLCYTWKYLEKQCAFTRNDKLEKLLGFKRKDDFNESHFYYLPIEDMKSTRGFYSHTYCTYKGFRFFVHSYNVLNDNLFCISPCSYEAAEFIGHNAAEMNYGMVSIHVPLSEIEEIHYEREKLSDFIFDVEPIEYVWKDGKWLIEPDNGVYIIYG